jgi:hypothetical protein
MVVPYPFVFLRYISTSDHNIIGIQIDRCDIAIYIKVDKEGNAMSILDGFFYEPTVYVSEKETRKMSIIDPFYPLPPTSHT